MAFSEKVAMTSLMNIITYPGCKIYNLSCQSGCSDDIHCPSVNGNEDITYHIDTKGVLVLQWLELQTFNAVLGWLGHNQVT